MSDKMHGQGGGSKGLDFAQRFAAACRAIEREPVYSGGQMVGATRGRWVLHAPHATDEERATIERALNESAYVLPPSTRIEPMPAQPDPAPGQVWQTKRGNVLTLGAPDPTWPEMFRVNDGYMNARHFIDAGEWTYIGIETPNGRIEPKPLETRTEPVMSTPREYKAPPEVIATVERTIAEYTAKYGRLVPSLIPKDLTFQDFAPDPRAAREARRREIDAILAEDARRFPAFATARRCAVMAAHERHVPYASDVPGFLAALRSYETHLSRGMRPERAKQEEWEAHKLIPHGWRAAGIAAYDRARRPS